MGILGMQIPNFCAQPYVQNREIAHFHITRANIQSITALTYVMGL